MIRPSLVTENEINLFIEFQHHKVVDSPELTIPATDTTPEQKIKVHHRRAEQTMINMKTADMLEFESVPMRNGDTDEAILMLLKAYILTPTDLNNVHHGGSRLNVGERPSNAKAAPDEATSDGIPLPQDIPYVGYSSVEDGVRITQ